MTEILINIQVIQIFLLFTQSNKQANFNIIETVMKTELKIRKFKLN